MNPNFITMDAVNDDSINSRRATIHLDFRTESEHQRSVNRFLRNSAKLILNFSILFFKDVLTVFKHKTNG
jgi:hypothetical protein